MRRLIKRSKAQLALVLERPPKHELSADQESALLLTLADLLLEALGEASPVSPTEPGEPHEP